MNPRSKGRTSHGKTKSRAYKTWGRMINRCSNPKNKDYSDYGGRGIKVCDRWQLFENFYADMGEPSKGYSIDRINNDGNYEPSNCRWATNLEQARNKRNNKNITYQGKTQCIAAWAVETGIDQDLLSQRLIRGWTVEDTLTKPTIKIPVYEYCGKKQSLKDWAKEIGIEHKTLWNRIKTGWTIEKALTTPLRSKNKQVETVSQKLSKEKHNE